MKYTRNTDREVVMSNMVEINFVDQPEDGFRKVKETLGLADSKEETGEDNS